MFLGVRGERARGQLRISLALLLFSLALLSLISLLSLGQVPLSQSSYSGTQKIPACFHHLTTRLSAFCLGFPVFRREREREGKGGITERDTEEKEERKKEGLYRIMHFFFSFLRVSRAARVACSNTSRTPSLVLAEHSRYFWAPIFLRTSSACSRSRKRVS